jgi:hypothetical protein
MLTANTHGTLRSDLGRRSLFGSFFGRLVRGFVGGVLVVSLQQGRREEKGGNEQGCREAAEMGHWVFSW